MNQFQTINADAERVEKKKISRQFRDTILSREDAFRRLKNLGLTDQQANDTLLDAQEESL